MFEWRPLVAAEMQWFERLRLSLITKPCSLISVSWFRTSPLILYMGYVWSMPKERTAVLCTKKGRPREEDQFTRPSTADCKASRSVSQFTTLISFQIAHIAQKRKVKLELEMYIENKVGERTLPCFRPVGVSWTADVSLPTRTWNARFVRKSWIHRTIQGWILTVVSLCNSKTRHFVKRLHKVKVCSLNLFPTPRSFGPVVNGREKNRFSWLATAETVLAMWFLSRCDSSQGTEVQRSS